jgi:hypothetical protein
MSLYMGSPLALLQLERDFERSRNNPLQRSPSSLVYSLRTHKAMRAALHLISPDVFYSTDKPLAGLIPSRDSGPSSSPAGMGRVGLCPLAKVETRSLQTICRLTATSLRVQLTSSVESELANLAYASMQTPPPRGGRPPPPPSKLTTGQRRLLIGLHTGQGIAADKSAANASPPNPPTADGKALVPPPGSLVPPKAINLEEDRSARGFAAPGGLIALKAVNNASATLEGFVNSPSVALVVELQVEVTLPPPAGRQYEKRTKWLTLGWGCFVPVAEPLQLSSSNSSPTARPRLSRTSASSRAAARRRRRRPSLSLSSSSIPSLALPSNSSRGRWIPRRPRRG